MPSTSETTAGSADRWGPLWGARPADWALNEDQQAPTYEEALRRVELRDGQLVLDIGCGAGAFLHLVSRRGARPFGLDASGALLELARRRVPDADLRTGEMEALPYQSDHFDLVCGFNSFFFAHDIVGAVREAGRVAKPGAAVVIQVWGPHDQNELEAMKAIARPFLPPRPADAPPEPDYSRPGVLEDIAARAGLEPEQTFDVSWAYEYPDEATARRALVAPAGLALLAGRDREEQLKDAIIAGLAEHRSADGGYRLRNTFHGLIARAHWTPIRAGPPHGRSRGGTGDPTARVSEDDPVDAGAVSIELLGRFRVAVGRREVVEGGWPSRRAGELVALVALGGGRMTRDEVVERLWPRLDARAGAANLRKAAHYARRALGAADAVVLRAGAVELFPGRPLSVDVDRFLAAAERALREDDADACARIAAGFAGELLPECRYESWTQEPRRRVHARRCQLLRRAGQWERLLELEPTDEPACREVMRAALTAGRRHLAVRAYEHLRTALARELGVRPDADTRALYDECCAAIRPADPIFVGRELELAEASAHLRFAVAGRSSALLVRGPSGIGKSAFCREIAHRARDDGWRVVAVTAQAAGEPYGPVRAAVEQLVLRGPALVQALPERTRSILAALTPLAPAAPPPAGALTRHQIIAALRRVLGTDPAPCLLLVEDAHQLDEASADVLHQLVAGDDAALLVALPYRAEWVRTSLPRGVVALGHGDRTLTIALGPLEEGAISELVRVTAPLPASPAHVARIAELSGGSPFYALELARAPATAFPETRRQAVLGRLVGLDAATFDAVTRLAIGGQALDLATVLALTTTEHDDAFDTLDAALDAGVLVVAGAGYRFRHELVRQVLIDELPGHRRLQLHREAARRLTAAGAPPESIADHWLRGERPAEAVPWLLAAAHRAVAFGAFADALTHVERLLVEAPDHHEGLALRAEILDALGDVRAPEAYATAATAAGRPEADELRARQALAELKASNPDRALRTLAGVQPRSVAGRLAEALTLSAAAAIGRYGDAETAAAKAQEAHRLALQSGDPGAVLDATWAHALAAHAKGELPARLREYLHATHELPELATRVFDGQLCVTERMLYGGLPNEEIIAFAGELAREAERIGAARGLAFAHTLRGEAELLAGRLDEADRDFTAGARLHGRVGAVAGEALSLLGRAQVAVRRSRHAQATPFLAQALAMARESEVGHHTLDRVYGAMVEAAGDADRALRIVRDAEVAIQGPAETCPTCRIAFIVPATIAAARAGDLERAGLYASDCERALQIVALPPAWTAAVDEARGWLARAGGREDVARERFLRAAEGFRTWGQPLDAVRAERAAA